MKFSGQKQNYFWLEWEDRSAFLSILIDSYPQIVLGKYLLNTSFDSGSLSLSDEEIQRGWKKYRDTTLSPIIEDVSTIPSCHYDEWYVFQKSNNIRDYEVFINYYCFSLKDENFAEIHKKFWRQIVDINPESYLAEGDNLIFVTKNKSLFRKILEGARF